MSLPCQLATTRLIPLTFSPLLLSPLLPCHACMQNRGKGSSWAELVLAQLKWLGQDRPIPKRYVGPVLEGWTYNLFSSQNRILRWHMNCFGWKLLHIYPWRHPNMSWPFIVTILAVSIKEIQRLFSPLFFKVIKMIKTTQNTRLAC